MKKIFSLTSLAFLFCLCTKLNAQSGAATAAGQTAIVNAINNNTATVGYLLTSTVEITRPTNTTAYAAYDAIATSSTAPTILTFSSIARTSAGTGYISKVRVVTDQSTNTARYRLTLYTATITAINDNDPKTTLYANNALRVGIIDLDAAQTDGSGSTAAYSINSFVRLSYKLSSGTALYGLLETLDAFTPTSGQKFFIEITSDCN